MSAVTRDLQPYAFTRLQSIEVNLIYPGRVTSPNNDGSFTRTPVNDYRKGYLTALTDKEIERLRESGLTIVKGAKLTLNEELDEAPDQVQYNKSDTYTYDTTAKVVKYSIAEGATVLILDTEPLDHA